MNRSPFFYVGDKYKLMPQLTNLFPKRIKRLIEPFAGGGSVFLNTKSKKYLANDNNSYMVQLHKFLFSFKSNRECFFKDFENVILKYGFSASFLGRTVSDELKKKHVKTYYAVYNKEAYKKLKDDFNKNKTNLMLLYVLLIYGFNHMLRFNNAGDFNLPVGNVDYNRNVYNALNAYFDFVDENMVDFFALDFQTFLEGLSFEKGDLVYVDPPYLISASEYNKYWTEKEERRLLEVLDWLDSKGVKFALSNVVEHKGNKNVFLIEWAKKYKVYSVSSNYISFNDNTIKRNTKEVLITNYGKSKI